MAGVLPRDELFRNFSFHGTSSCSITSPVTPLGESDADRDAPEIPSLRGLLGRRPFPNVRPEIRRQRFHNGTSIPFEAEGRSPTSAEPGSPTSLFRVK